MTDQPRAACCVCFRAFPEPGQRKCPTCQGRPAPTVIVTKRAKATPLDLAALPEPSEAELAAYLAGTYDQA